MGKLEGKAALVTGGTSGIGFATAELLCKEGATVVLAARDPARGAARQQALADEGGDAVFVPCDVTDSQDVKRLCGTIRERFGCLDILINSAGIFLTEGLEGMTEACWDDIFDTNLKSVMFLCQQCMPLLALAKEGGVILNVASDVGLQDIVMGRSNYAYAASKAGLIQFSQLLAKNYGPQVRVNCLCPGSTATDLWGNKDFERFRSTNILGKIIQAEDIARIALFLVSDDAAVMTGSVVLADAGARLKR